MPLRASQSFNNKKNSKQISSMEMSSRSISETDKRKESPIHMRRNSSNISHIIIEEESPKLKHEAIKK